MNPGDADALGGLGVVRLRENRTAEARTLLERAVAADPTRGAQWRRALESANYTLELAEARALLRRGDTAGAEVILRRATKREVEDATDAESLLGEAALHRGDPAEAERHFRTALARRPGFAPAGTGLNQALRAQGRLAEVPEPRPRAADGGAPVNTEAARLRAEASRAADPATEAALLQNAVALAPNDPWIRLDLARALRRQGRNAEGRALVEELAARSPSADSAYAAALLAQEGGGQRMRRHSWPASRRSAGRRTWPGSACACVPRPRLRGRQPCCRWRRPTHGSACWPWPAGPTRPAGPQPT